MKFSHDIAAWACAFLFATGALVSAQVFVSPNGSDQSEGTKEQPAATLAQAINLARKTNRHDIVVAPGEYFDVSANLDARDSGLTIEAAQGHKAVLIGGIKLTHWQKDGTFVSAKLPDGADWDVRMLQVNGRLCPRARFPETGTLQSVNKWTVPWSSATEGGWARKPTLAELTTLLYKPGDVPTDIATANAEVTVFHAWDESCVGISKIDPATHTITLSLPVTYPPGAFHHHEYVIWNTREGMTQPGQWYWDRAARTIVYWPLPGEDFLSSSAPEAVVPTQHSIIAIKGAKGAPIKNVTLKNLALEVATVPLTAAGMGGDKYPGAIQLGMADATHIENVSVRQVAGHAIKAANDCTGIDVENCDVSECGAGGIYIWGDKTVIKNNLVHAIGRMYSSGIGIHGSGTDCLLAHNEVFDTPYTAIDFRGQNVIIEYNLLHDCMKVLQDGGAIYMFKSTNCVMRGNVARDFRDTGNLAAGAIAYYLDEGCTGCTVEGNLSINIPWPSHNHMATLNTILNNVFITQKDMRLSFNRSSDFTVDGNVCYAGGRVRFEIGDDFDWKDNLIYSAIAKVETIQLNMSGNGTSVRSTSTDPPGDTKLADPGFVDLSGGDYRFKPDGAAGKLGLKGVDAKLAGRQITPGS